jgi:hypothetical protein
MSEQKVAEFLYDVLKRNAKQRQDIGDVIAALLDYKTENKVFSNVAIILAMIHAAEENN